MEKIKDFLKKIKKENVEGFLLYDIGYVLAILSICFMAALDGGAQVFAMRFFIKAYFVYWSILFLLKCWTTGEMVKEKYVLLWMYIIVALALLRVS